MSRPQIQIHATADLPPQQQAELQALFDAQFAGSSFHWAAPQWHVLTYLGTALVVCVRVFERTISVGNQPLHVGGVGGVMTLPEWRHRGLASMTLRRAAEFMRHERRVAFALLLCRDEVAPVYAKLGWEFAEGPTSCEQPSGRVTYPRRTMILRFGTQPWPPGPIDLRGLPW